MRWTKEISQGRVWVTFAPWCYCKKREPHFAVMPSFISFSASILAIVRIKWSDVYEVFKRLPAIGSGKAIKVLPTFPRIVGLLNNPTLGIQCRDKKAIVCNPNTWKDNTGGLPVWFPGQILDRDRLYPRLLTIYCLSTPVLSFVCPCGGLSKKSPQRSTGSGAIRSCSHFGEGVTLLEEVSLSLPSCCLPDVCKWPWQMMLTEASTGDSRRQCDLFPFVYWGTCWE